MDMFRLFRPFDEGLLVLINGGHSIFLDGIMLSYTSGTTWLPLYVVLLYIIIKRSTTMEQILIVVGCAVGGVLLASFFANMVCKPIVERMRPCNDFSYFHILTPLPGVGDKSFSFFSAHAANTSVLATYFGLLIRRKIVWIALVFWSLANCYTRLYLCLHFPTDIIAGLFVGSTIGIMMYIVRKQFRMNKGGLENSDKELIIPANSYSRELRILLLTYLFIHAYVLAQGFLYFK